MMVPQEDIDNRFTYHPADPARGELHSSVRRTLRGVAGYFNETLPPGRELATALTKLEEVMFWANAALARSLA